MFTTCLKLLQKVPTDKSRVFLGRLCVLAGTTATVHGRQNWNLTHTHTHTELLPALCHAAPECCRLCVTQRTRGFAGWPRRGSCSCGPLWSPRQTWGHTRKHKDAILQHYLWSRRCWAQTAPLLQFSTLNTFQTLHPFLFLLTLNDYLCRLPGTSLQLITSKVTFGILLTSFFLPAACIYTAPTSTELRLWLIPVSTPRIGLEWLFSLDKHKPYPIRQIWEVTPPLHSIRGARMSSNQGLELRGVVSHPFSTVSIPLTRIPTMRERP